VIEGSKGTAYDRRWVVRDRPVFTARAIVGTKAVKVEMSPQHSGAILALDVDAAQTFTELNVESELRETCLFVLADWELAQTTVKAGY